MKIKKILALLLVATIAIPLGGCEQTLPRETGDATIDSETGDVSTDMPSPHDDIAETTIFVSENGDLRSAMINEINMARTMDRETLEKNTNAVAHEINKVAEMTEFYYPRVEIDGYELHRVDVDESAYVYMYAPVGADERLYGVWESKVIRILVCRPENFREQSNTDIFRETVEYSVSTGFGILSEDGMLYSEKHGLIVALMEDTEIQVEVPPSLNSYDYLHSLARQVIDTAELVRVG